MYINTGAHGTQWQQLMGRLKGGLLPVWLGGTPRKYLSLGLLPTGELQREVAKWANDGLLKEVPIDSVLAMEDAPQVCDRSSIRPRSISNILEQGFAKVGGQHAKGKVVVQIAS